jgi:hypothetical protein
MPLFTTRKLGQDEYHAKGFLRVFPWVIVVVMAVLWATSTQHPSTTRDLTKLRDELWHVVAHWNHTISAHSSRSNAFPALTAAEAAAVTDHPWQFTASCNSPSSFEHLHLLEGLIDPKAFLQQLVKQDGHTWLQIGSNTMDSMNNNDPMKKLLDTIPSWKKVNEVLDCFWAVDMGVCPGHGVLRHAHMFIR